MAKARDIPGLGPGIPFREAAALAIGVRGDEVWEHEQRVLDTADIEGVHDMRVATRRLRAAMEVFAPCLPRKEHRRRLSAVKRFADALGERRDPDVMIDHLRRIEAGLTQEDKPGIESLVAELRAGQDDANERLRAELQKFHEARG